MISRTRRRRIGASLLSVFVLECILPTIAVALTSGPAQPEFSSFEPVSSSGMVNEFTGGFTYNLPVISIPGAQGGGYAMSLSYHNGVTSEQDASWVGLGWTLNPGAISRQANGIPDDFKGQTVSYFNKSRKNKTMAIIANFDVELASGDLGFGVEYGVRHNTFRGWSTIQGFNASAFGVASMSIGVDDGMSSFSASVNPVALLYLAAGRPRFSVEGENKTLAAIANAFISPSIGVADNYIGRALHIAKYPQPGPAMEGEQFSLRIGATLDPIPLIPLLAGPRVGLTGNYSWQSGIESLEKQVYGSLYTGDADSYDGVMDYYVDKEAYFEEKDKYLGVPHANLDNFRLMGEGLAGTIRAFNRSVGRFRPNRVKSYINSYDGGLDLSLGAKWGLGGAVSAGYSKTEVKGPGAFVSLPGIQFNHGFQPRILANGNEVDRRGTYLGFDGDKGGHFLAAETDEPVKASPLLRGTMSISSTDIKQMVNDGARPGNSSAVEFVTNAEMLELSDSGIVVSAQTKRNDILRGFIDRSDPLLADAIGEICVTNPQGLKYVYGLPVYSRNEEQLSFSPTQSDASNNVSYNGRTRVNKNLTKHTDGAYYTGQNQTTPYASQFLLTDITTSDYIDINYDGPTPDDFGGYTRFEYRRTAGTWNKSSDSAMDWYRWRLPYVGFIVNNGKLLDGYDDRLSVSSGEREQYYLEAVKTKTHVAYFVTNKADISVQTSDGLLQLKGTDRERLDAYEAYRFTNNDSINETESAVGMARFFPNGDWDPNLAGRKVLTHSEKPSFSIDSQEDVEAIENKQEYLEKILLYSLDENGEPDKLLKTVNFEYDYSLMEWNKEETKYSFYDTIDNDYIKHVKTYNYPSHLNSASYFNTNGLHEVHSDTVAVARKLGKLTLKRVWFEYEGVVNATIAPYDFDYEYARKADFPQSIVDKYDAILSEYEEGHLIGSHGAFLPQNPHFELSNNDRWGQFRVDGGKLLRKYFPYVKQNVTESLSAAPWTLKKITLPSGGEIHVQYEDHDYSFVQDQRAMAMVGVENFDGQNLYLNTDEYFGTLDADERDWLVDEIHERFVVGGEKMYFKFLYNFTCRERENRLSEFAEPPKTGIDYVSGYVDVKRVSVTGAGRVYIETDGDVTFGDLAKEYETATVYGLGCNEHYAGDGGSKDKDLVDYAKEVLDFMPFVGAAMVVGRELGNPPPTYDQFSYVRVPVMEKKRGGGQRVKRLLMYDKGLESGDAVLYGTEYSYVTERSIGGRVYSISSGVATNEPAIGREENALVKFQPRRGNPTFFQALIAGNKIEQYEGPLFEGQLPGPSIGYSRVVSQNIHKGKTGTGFSVVEYNTVKDFPLLADWTGLEKKQSNSNPIASMFFNFSHSQHSGSQGYSFVHQNLHGTVKKVEAWGGEYESPSTHYLVASSQTEYAIPQKETVKIFNGVGEAMSDGWPGKTIEVIQESKYQLDKYQNHMGSWDAGIALPPLIFLPIPFASISYRQVNNTKTLNTHVIVKNISYPPIVKQVRQYKEGVWHTTKNIAFDSKTGTPVISRTHDGFDGLRLSGSQSNHSGWYTTYSIPGHSQYEEIGQAVENLQLEYLNGSLTPVGGGEYVYSNTGIDLKLYPGDLLRLFDQSKQSIELAHVVQVISSSSVKCVPAGIALGLTAAGSDVNARVVRSSRTNQLTTTVGALVSYGESESGVLSANYLSNGGLDSSVVSASAMTLSDTWDYDNLDYTPNPSANVFESGERGRWRPKSSYTYMTNRKSAHATPEARIHASAGAYDEFQLFDWSSTPHENWLKTTSIDEYSPHGEVLEETNALFIPSSARFYHRNLVPSIVAANALKQDIYFESFEEGTLGTKAPNAHTGSKLLSINGITSADPKEVMSIDVSSRMNSSGLLVRFWFKGEGVEPPHVVLNTLDVEPDSIAHCGEWKLYELTQANPPIGQTSVKFYYEGGTHGSIDDVKIQPVDAQTACYVYDQSTLRLIAQFDDQHFAMLYQYNGEGKLVRTMKETERGVKTLAETQYHTPLVTRNQTAFQLPSAIVVPGPPEVGNSNVDRYNTMLAPSSKDLNRFESRETELLDLRLSPYRTRLNVLQQPTISDSTENDNE